MSEVKASPRSPALGALSDILRRVRDKGNSVRIPLVDLGIGDMLLGKSPEEIDEWAYGNASLQVVGGGTGSLVPQLKRGRGEQLADTIFAAQGAVPTLQSAGKLAKGALSRMFENTAPSGVRQAGAVRPRSANDLHNTGLTRVGDRYFTQTELDEIQANIKHPDYLYLMDNMKPGYKDGGLVKAHGGNAKQASTSIYQRLQDVLASVAPDSYAQDAVNRLKNEHSYAKEYKLGLNGLGLPMEKFGLNLTSQPQVYLPPTIKKEFVRENKDLPYDVGGQSSPLRGIELNPYSRMFDKAGTLVHEVSHQRDYGASGVRADLPKGIGAGVIDKIGKHKAAGDDYRRMRILSGQQEPDEIRAQLRAYEALLPAGMSIFQSPLGKEVFQTPEEKLWYINQTQPSMTDQKYLEELTKQKFARGGLVEVEDDFAYPGMF